jgi:hypothetical protein
MYDILTHYELASPTICKTSCSTSIHSYFILYSQISIVPYSRNHVRNTPTPHLDKPAQGPPGLERRNHARAQARNNPNIIQSNPIQIQITGLESSVFCRRRGVRSPFLPPSQHSRMSTLTPAYTRSIIHARAPTRTPGRSPQLGLACFSERWAVVDRGMHAHRQTGAGCRVGLYHVSCTMKPFLRPGLHYSTARSKTRSKLPSAIAVPFLGCWLMDFAILGCSSLRRVSVSDWIVTYIYCTRNNV